MRITLGKNRNTFAAAFTLMEVMVAVLVAGVALMALYASTFQSFGMLKSTRENLQATQVLMDRLEQIRLANWTQITDAATRQSLWPSPYTTNWSSLGTTFTFTTTMEVSDLPSSYSGLSYQGDMKMVKIAILWTNDMKVRRSNEMTTFIARYGLQRYIQ